MTEAHTTTAALTDASAYAHRRLDCDLVMKGGITSGVIYPLAVAELARTYRFRNIGGTSAGAIAAAAAAAAQHEGTGEGFVQLAAIPDELGGQLQQLFQPQKKCRRLFRLVLTGTAKPETTTGKIGKFVKLMGCALAFLGSVAGMVLLLSLSLPALGIGLGLGGSVADHWHYGLVPLAALLIIGVTVSKLTSKVERQLFRLAAIVFAVALIGGLLIAVMWRGGIDGWAVAAWFAICVVTLVLVVLIAIVWEAVRVIPANDYGLVGGSAVGTRGSNVEPLSEWLHTMIQSVAGLADDAAPLTFGQLADGPPGQDGVNLTLLTTCLTQGRTYYLPHDTQMHKQPDRFYVDLDELRRSMPAAVVDYLEKVPRSGDWLDHALNPLVPLPPPDQMPVVMATRMSLSFPVLISAVPLRAVDWTLSSNRQARAAWSRWHSAETRGPKPTERLAAEPCWFSDGGIISNFPVHLFDSMLPNHPTFGVNLRGFHPDRTDYDDDDQPEVEKIWRPLTNGSGQGAWWTRWNESGRGALLGFAGAIADTMQNWSDNDQTRVPGYRDRVVHVSHGKAEGGLNLAMPADRIQRLGERGLQAALNLERAFAHEDPGTDAATGVVVATGWKNHKWVRLRSSFSLLTSEIASLRENFDEADPVGVASYRGLIDEPLEDAPGYDATQLQRDALLRFLDGDADAATDGGLLGASDRLAGEIDSKPAVSPANKAPGPAPKLRITPGHRQRRSGDTS
jgi:predicted acylesterase/phospholipase RssA